MEPFNPEMASKFYYVKILKLLRLNRLGNLNKTIEKFDFRPSSINFIMMLIVSFFIVHNFACLWYFITTGMIDVPRTWVEEFGYKNSTVPELYVSSYYFTTVTMLTVGYGDM